MNAKKCPCGCGRDVDPATGLLFADDSCLTRVLAVVTRFFDDMEKSGHDSQQLADILERIEATGIFAEGADE